MMFHKRNGRKLDPTKINTYNNFLRTLDEKQSFLKNENFEKTYIKNKSDLMSESSDSTVNIHTQNHNHTQNQNKNGKESNGFEDIKNELDIIIEQINKNFTIRDYNSTAFTGKTSEDVNMSSILINDQNIYKDDFLKTQFFKYYRPSSLFSSENHENIVFKREREKEREKDLEKDLEKDVEKEVEVKEHININVEINSIHDILELLGKYKLDPSIKYNINMKALHEIKEPLEELNTMIGMRDLKSNIVDQILYFVQELHKNKKGSGDFMHTVIYGPPGTGKTEIAKIMGKIYSKIGVLNKGTFKKVTRSDLVAGYLGQTAIKTKDVIKEAIGGVLFIDEAYSLGNYEKKDSFAKECIDTLCEALSDNKENLMVIIAGYEKELKDCFFSINQGLDSRFTWRFKTDDYSYEDLYNIFVKMVIDIGWEIDENSKITAEWFKKNNDYFCFFGRDIETILAKTKIAHSKRVFCKEENEKKKITIQDLEKGFEMYMKNETVKNKRNDEMARKQLYHTIYS